MGQAPSFTTNSPSQPLATHIEKGPHSVEADPFRIPGDAVQKNRRSVARAAGSYGSTGSYSSAGVALIGGIVARVARFIGFVAFVGGII
ncbi:hypothetical protein MNBD_ACTINO02-1349, partial [hydrothermal vent metagenome]